jgi:hypothetical protein
MALRTSATAPDLQALALERSDSEREVDITLGRADSTNPQRRCQLPLKA